MELWMVDWLWLMGAFFIGVFFGCMTGLIPGFHVNNVAMIAVSLSPLAIGLGIPLSAVAAIIVSMGTVHTFLNYIPGALLGAPDGDTALALLPGHRMLLSGKATQGVAYSARGSQLGLLLSIPLLLFARFLFGENPGLGFYEESREILPYLLLAISSFLILTESTRLAWPKWMQNFSQKWKINLFGKEFDFSFSDSSNVAGIIAAGSFFLLSGFYGWAVFTLPASSPVGLPGGSSGGTMLMPGLAGLFGIANLIDIYVTTSEMPEQDDDWEIPPAGPLIIPCFLSSICASVMAILPGMTAAQATVVVMTVRNFFGKLRDPDYIPADFEFGPGQTQHPAMQALSRRKAAEASAESELDSQYEQSSLLSDESGAMAVAGAPLSDVELAMLDEARKERAISPDLDLELQTSKQDLEVIAILSATNTAVTVMVLAFLYLVGRPRSGAALALNMMYPIDPWSGVEPPPDFIKLIAVTVGAGLISVPLMMKVGKAMLKLHEIIPLRTLVMSVLIFIALLSWMTTGWIGMGVLITGTVLGLMPPRIGIRRSHGMGIILVPIMIYTFAAKVDKFGFA
ncbi:MAG: tripartite tricarboxylate transporter permease [Candidatus Thalassarchaeaceae archaeon]|jgi:putative membrane protein|nr:tripartite tricarboxylate transporter permease [Candidatus Thalassarchaeaceae archaeon]